jgi:hypothetical protein
VGVDPLSKQPEKERKFRTTLSAVGKCQSSRRIHSHHRFISASAGRSDKPLDAPVANRHSSKAYHARVPPIAELGLPLSQLLILLFMTDGR